jgi:Ca2+-binding EF-hand superfamily protein
MGSICGKSNSAVADGKSIPAPRRTIFQVLGSDLRSTKAEALSETDAKVTAKKQKWLAKQKHKINSAEASDWEYIFDETCRDLKTTELSMGQLEEVFKKLGSRVNRAMLQLIFSMFDANNNGKVDKTEFLVAISFLANAAKTKDLVDLAFYLFDTNKSGQVSMEEFSTMCYALMNKAKFVLGVPVFRAAFRKHVEAELCQENLNFYEDYEKVRKVIKPAQQRSDARRGSAFAELVPEEAVLTIQDARDLFAKYIYEGAPEQVNLVDANRRHVEELIRASEHLTPTAIVSADAFDACIIELLALMEADSMGRFKEKIRNDKLWISQQVWESEHIKGHNMTKAQFRKWASNNPNTFVFLHELQVTLKKALYRQKIMSAIMIQRAYRARLRTKLRQVVTGAVAVHAGVDV